MIETLIVASLLGFFAGAVPGPYTTMVAGTALDRGFPPAFRLAFVPVITDVPPMLLTSMVLDRVSYGVLTWVGVMGGVVIIGLGVRYFRRPRKMLKEAEEDARTSERRNFLAVATAGLLSPAPWLFWTVAASPLLLSSWNEHWVRGVVFALVLFIMLIGTATAIGWGASHGHRALTVETRGRILRVVGILLVGVGGVMIWQSYEGNFQSMVKRQELLRESVEQSAAPRTRKDAPGTKRPDPGEGLPQPGGVG